MQISSPIDIVYLWVDGNDDGWRAKRLNASNLMRAQGDHAIARFGNVEGRFRDNDELRYSLRALAQFFPDHGHVYIVTDGQVPAWLKTSDRLTLIDHRDLIPESALPTFDSGNIESYIHRIPGLAERYFYFNDDVFFGAPVQVSDWFFDGGFYVAWSDDPEVVGHTMQTDATSLENASRLSKEWLEAKADARSSVLAQPQLIHQLDATYIHTARTFAHSPRPMLKSILMTLEDEAADLFARVRSTVFRSWDKPTIVSDFVLRWALAHGVAQIKDHSHLYVATGDARLNSELDQLRSQFGLLDFFCINDTTDDAMPDDPRLTQVRHTLQQLLPTPSSHELHVQPLGQSDDLETARRLSNAAMNRRHMNG
ncbi:stealth family protein [Limnohabitans sp. B9-3]|uniref:stealth family protein n=1 Tax=Limnohabitans sp. B9-3 TaxID=1100707 RepID=UPI000C1F0F8D|nr:stealth family protein [Limnohabitans sp. B9-3]PIT76254.1 exopolysaccharide phosphotransferase [Limnohabitans sp. B9-3]